MRFVHKVTILIGHSRVNEFFRGLIYRTGSKPIIDEFSGVSVRCQCRRRNDYSPLNLSGMDIFLAR